MITLSRPSHSAIRCAPQSRQKCRSFPGLDSKAPRDPSPASQRNPARGARAVAANGAECAFWQVWQ